MVRLLRDKNLPKVKFLPRIRNYPNGCFKDYPYWKFIDWKSHRILPKKNHNSRNKKIIKDEK